MSSTAERRGAGTVRSQADRASSGDPIRRETPAPGGPRVLEIFDRLGVGGAERLAVSLADGLRARGADLRLVQLGSRQHNRLERETERLSLPVMSLGIQTVLAPGAILRLARCLRDERIDLVHTHQRRAHLIGRIAAFLAGRPVISTLHSILEVETSWGGRVLRQLDYLTARAFTSRVILVCEAQRSAYLRNGRLPSGRVQTCFNGVDTRLFRPDRAARERLRAALEVSPETLLVVTTANHRPGKGLEVLLEAAAQARALIPEARFLLAGDGTDDPALRAQAEALGLGETFRVLGLRADVPALLAAADVYLHPSTFDVLPTSVLEAMSTGLAVVATRVGGLPEMVSDGLTGLLVPPGQPAQLAAALTRLREPARRAAIGRRARAWVERHADRELWLDRHLQIYREVIGQQH